MQSHYIGARYIPLVYEGPDGSPDWLPGVAYEGLTIVKYGNFSYISKKPVPAGAGDPDTDTSYWIRASLYNADVEEVRSLLDQKADKDGSYPELWAGNIMTDKHQTDRTPYIMRRTGGGLQKISEREDDTLVGATVNVNQLVDVDTSSVTIQNSHKYYAKISGTKSIGASTGAAISVTGGTDIVTDLTDYFGSTIADYLYSLEQATAGAGVAKLKEWGFLTGEYIPYNAGSLECVEATAHVMRDADENIIGNYSLGTDTLRGLFKLDSNNNLYADGDTKTSDGTVTRKYGVVDLGTLNWTKTVASNIDVGYVYQTGLALSVSGSLNCILSKYQLLDKIGLSANVVAYGSGLDKVAFRSSNKNMYIIDSSYADAESFKAAMSGVYLVYELATPTTEQSTPFTNPQICDPDGTEEYVTSNGVPVGHETEYFYSIKRLAEELINIPDVPDQNGTYTLKATRNAAGLKFTWEV